MGHNGTRLKYVVGIPSWSEELMRRRDFLAKGTLAAGLAGSTGLLKPLMASETQPQKPSAAPEKAPKPAEEIRSPEFLNRSRKEKFPPKVPEFAASHLSPDVRVSPMPLEERLRRGIVPLQGFCSLIPGTTISEGLTSGNGHMNIEATCDPYSEQVLFHHESLLVPWKRPQRYVASAAAATNCLWWWLLWH